jgi:hypothetical protein
MASSQTNETEPTGNLFINPDQRTTVEGKVKNQQSYSGLHRGKWQRKVPCFWKYYHFVEKNLNKIRIHSQNFASYLCVH